MTRKTRRTSLKKKVQEQKEKQNESSESKFKKILLSINSYLGIAASIASVMAVWIIWNFDLKFKPLILKKIDIIQSSDVISCNMISNFNVDKETVLITQYPLTRTLNSYDITPELEWGSGVIKKFKIGFINGEDEVELLDLKNDSNLYIVELHKGEWIITNQQKKSMGQFQIQSSLNNDIKLLHAKIEGFDNDPYYITYILIGLRSTGKLEIFPLYDSDITLDNQYKKIFSLFSQRFKTKEGKEIKDEVIWENINFNHFSEFKKYILNQRKQFIKRLEEIGE